MKDTGDVTMRVLLVEDDLPLGRGTRQALQLEGHQVDWVTRAEDASQWLRQEEFDVLVLDWRLPGQSGIELLGELRRDGFALPTLMLTARHGLQEKVTGLDAGADDYLTKPFDLEELSARVRALGRRGHGWSSATLRQGALVLDPGCRQAFLGGQALELSAREFQVLEGLLLNSGRFVSKQQLEERIYAWDSTVRSNTIEVYIYRLRELLGPEVIRTRRGVGYRLEMPCK